MKMIDEIQKNRIVELWNMSLSEWPLSADRILSCIQSGKTIWSGNEGFINYKIGKSKGQITLIIVDPKMHRYGIGTKLLSLAIQDLHRHNIAEIFIGSGVGNYFWPGIPYNLPNAISFFRSVNYTEVETNFDMLMNLKEFVIKDFKLPNIHIRGPVNRKEILIFEETHFPNWKKYFEFIELQDILVAECNHAIVGSVISFTEKEFPWTQIVPSTGGFGCLGVAEDYRRQGIGFVLANKATEKLCTNKLKHSYLGWTYLDKWYGQLGYRIWQKYSYGKIIIRLGINIC